MQIWKNSYLFCGSLFTTNYCGKDDARWVIETNDDADEWLRQTGNAFTGTISKIIAHILKRFCLNDPFEGAIEL